MSLPTVGIIIGERVYNMPPQVMPPLYKILHDEIGWAIEDVSRHLFCLETFIRVDYLIE